MDMLMQDHSLSVQLMEGLVSYLSIWIAMQESVESEEDI